MNFDSHVFTDLLKIPNDDEQHVVFCPFHIDSGTRSLSVDLRKGVFYCHGGCPEPKGGGPVEFLMRWAEIVEKKKISREEAKKRLRRTFVLPDAKTLLRELAA